MKRGRTGMSKKSGKVYITYNERTEKYYVGQTESPSTRYAAHRNTYGREVIADFTASDDRSERLEEEREMFQFCEAMGLPLENGMLLRWYTLERE
jgi:predicted GIY-YIG superfamily endonuclease